MKTIKNWLLSAATVMLMSVSFGQSNSLTVFNNTTEEIHVKVWAVIGCNVTPAIASTTYVIPIGGTAIIPPLANIGTHPGAEWILAIGTENVSGYRGAENPYMCSNIANYPIGGGPPFVLTPTIIVSVDWLNGFEVEFNQ